MSKKVAAAKQTTAKHQNLAQATNQSKISAQVLDNIKKHATPDAFGAAGKAAGLDIWRIENFKTVAWPKNLYGKFYDGDSYIVLDTRAVGNALKHNIHFWLGTNTSQDEAGTAAIKTVELDDHLGKEPIQYREVQSFESRQFLSYFPQGVTYLTGGVASGFTHVVAQQHVNRLLQIKGKKHIRVHQVPLHTHSLNDGDSFVLDAGDRVYQWNGKSAGVFEKIKGGELARSIKADRGGKPELVNLEEGGVYTDDFFKLLEGKPSEIESAEEGGSDLESDKDHQHKKLLRLSDSTGSLTFTEVADGDKVKKNLLNSDDVFVLDTGYEIFAWVGKNSSLQERKNALQYAQEYLNKGSAPTYHPIARILEGGENQAFNSAFSVSG